jgi:hypothetical protein
MDQLNEISCAGKKRTNKPTGFEVTHALLSSDLRDGGLTDPFAQMGRTALLLKEGSTGGVEGARAGVREGSGAKWTDVVLVLAGPVL